MTNDQLKDALEEMLASPMDDNTIFLLMDAAIHAAIIQKLDLTWLDGIFAGVIGLHQIMLVLGIPPQVSEADPFGQTLYTPKKQQEPPVLSEDENKRAKNILRDIKFDL